MASVLAEIASNLPEDLLNAGLGRQIDCGMPLLRHHLEFPGCTHRLRGRMSHRTALHEDNGMQTIAADRRGGQTEDKFRLGALKNGVKRRGANVMAFVNDDVAVVLHQWIDLVQPRQRLHHRNVDLARRSRLATTDGSDD